MKKVSDVILKLLLITTLTLAFKIALVNPQCCGPTVDFRPDVLNPYDAEEEFIAYIELGVLYNVHDINVSSIMLNGTISVDQSAAPSFGDYDRDGVADLAVEFDYNKVQRFIYKNLVDVIELPYSGSISVTLTITGKLNNEEPFEASDTIDVIVMYVTSKLGQYLVPHCT